MHQIFAIPLFGATFIFSGLAASDEVRPETLRGQQGYFRVGQAEDDRWWFIDAEGRRFLFRGVCAVNRAGTAGGRRAVPGPYAAAVDKRYNYPSGPKPFVEESIKRLREWNFNALGSWTTEEFFDQGMPYTEIVEFAKLEPSIHLAGVNLPDVFDPAWEKAVDEAAQKICQPRRDSKMLVGYFTDNELGWGQPHTDAIWGAAENGHRKGGPTLLQVCCSLPPESGSYQAAWKFVMDRHGNDLKKVAAAWEVPISKREDVAAMTQAGQGIRTPGYGADHDAFSREFTRQYLKLTAEAIRRYDPNHLILGARFGAPPGSAVLAEFKPPWVDVISANNYRRNMFERTDIYYQPNKMPVLIGEFSWAGGAFTERKNVPPEARADIPAFVTKAGPESLEQAFTHPGLVGYTWYRWVQNPEGEIGYGLVDTEDNPVPFNIRLLTDVNARLEQIATDRKNLPKLPP